MQVRKNHRENTFVDGEHETGRATQLRQLNGLEPSSPVFILSQRVSVIIIVQKRSKIFTDVRHGVIVCPRPENTAPNSTCKLSHIKQTLLSTYK